MTDERCPYCGAERVDYGPSDPRSAEENWACGTFRRGSRVWQSTECELRVAEAENERLRAALVTDHVCRVCNDRLERDRDVCGVCYDTMESQRDEVRAEIDMLTQRLQRCEAVVEAARALWSKVAFGEPYKPDVGINAATPYEETMALGRALADLEVSHD